MHVYVCAYVHTPSCTETCQLTNEKEVVQLEYQRPATLRELMT